MKKALIIVLIIVVSIFALSVAKDQIAKSIVSVVATNVMGAKVEMQGLSLGIIKQSVRITGFRMYNPAGFPKAVLIDMPKISVDYDIISLLKGRLHLPHLAIDLKEVNLVKNEEGKSNVDSLKVLKKDGPAKEETPQKKSSKQMDMQIDQLDLYIGKIVMTDYTVKPKPSIETHNINIKGSYKNVRSAQQLITLILVESINFSGIKDIGVKMLPRQSLIKGLFHKNKTQIK